MPADWSDPQLTDLYGDFLNLLKERDQDVLLMLDGITPTNLPTGAKRWSASNARFEKWSSTVWEELIALYEMKVRNSDQLNGQTASYYRNAGNLNAGTLPAAHFNDTAHGNRGNGSLPSVVTTSVNGFMIAYDKSKLNGSELLVLIKTVDGAGSGLDADLLDGQHMSYALDRNNHSGTQAVGTITGLGSLATKNTVANADIDQNTIQGNRFADYAVGSYAVGPRFSGTIESNSLVKRTEQKVAQDGTVRVRFKLSIPDYGTTAARVYKNGVAQGSTIAAGQIAITNVSVVRGDLIQLYGSRTDAGSSCQVTAQISVAQPECMAGEHYTYTIG